MYKAFRNSSKIRISSVLAIAVVVALFLIPAESLTAKKKGAEPLLPLYKTMSRPAPEYKVHDIGAVWNSVSNFGSFGDPEAATTGNPSMEWPAGGSSNYLYDASVMVTTILNGEYAHSSYFYDQKEWEPSEGYDFLIGNDEVETIRTAKSIKDSWVSFDDEDAEADHIPLGVRVERQGLSWSMPDYDDFIAYEFSFINTGLAGDLRGVFFSFWYDLDIASIDVTENHIDDLVDFDGYDGLDTQTDEVDWVDPMDLDGDGLTGYDSYGWPFGEIRNVASDGGDVGYDPDKIEPDGVYDEYTLIIDPDAPVVFADKNVEIGDQIISAGDTLRYADGTPVYGYKLSRGMSYMYDSDNPATSDDDTGERELNPPATGFVGGRMAYADPTESDYVFAVQDSVHVRYTRPYSHQWWNWESDPSNDREFYEYITATHQFSRGYRFLPNPRDVGAPTFDYRYLHAVGPYDLPVGDTVRVVWIEGIGEGLEGLRANLDRGLEAYYTGSQYSSPYNPAHFDTDVHWRLPAPPATPNLSYSTGENTVNLVWDNISEITPDTKTGLIDFAGYKVYRATYAPSNWTLIHIMFDTNMFEGDTTLFVTNADGDTLGYVEKSAATGISHKYTDQGGPVNWKPYPPGPGDVTTIKEPINGIPYFYSLVAFDTGDLAGTGLPPAESGKSNYKKSEAGAPVEIIPKLIYEPGTAIGALEDIKVVPNPYKGTGAFEDIYQSRVNFINLPPAAKISIFSLTGDMVQTILHADGTDSEGWNLLSRNDQAVVSGLYIYVVETDDDYYVGKFVVVR